MSFKKNSKDVPKNSIQIEKTLEKVYELVDSQASIKQKNFDNQLIDALLKNHLNLNNKPVIVPQKDVEIELGHPSCGSLSFILLTKNTNVISDVCLTIIGDDINKLIEKSNNSSTKTLSKRNLVKCSYAQIILLQIKGDIEGDKYEFEKTQYFADKLKDVAVRSMRERMWLRVHKSAVENAYSLEVNAALLFKEFKMHKNVEKVEVILCTSSNVFKQIQKIHDEWKIASGEHEKLFYTEDGLLECVDMNCNTCDEQQICDDIRDVIKIKNKFG